MLDDVEHGYCIETTPRQGKLLEVADEDFDAPSLCDARCARVSLLAQHTPPSAPQDA